MNREVHVRFWESARLRCLAPLAYLYAYESVIEARASIGRYLDCYNRALEHPSGYAIEVNRLCWSGCDPAGYLRF